LKGGQIRALEDGEGIGIVSSEGEGGRKIPCRDISPGGEKNYIDLILVPREQGKDKNQWTGDRRRRRGGGRSSCSRGGGEGRTPEEAGNRQKDPYWIIFFLLAGSETQRQVDDNDENDQADDADGGALGVYGNRRERSGGEGDDGDDNRGLSDWLRFNFEGEFHERSQRRRGGW
jgi:hypothetical protein